LALAHKNAKSLWNIAGELDTSQRPTRNFAIRSGGYGWYSEKSRRRKQEGEIDPMSKAFIAQVIQESTGCTGVAANKAAGELMGAIVRELKKTGGFTLPSFGTFTVRKTKARKAMNPRTGEPVKVKAGKTVRFKASPNLKKAV
jgi:DNA-binding protein HU-beta